jgi:hypothetical protein
MRALKWELRILIQILEMRCLLNALHCLRPARPRYFQMVLGEVRRETVRAASACVIFLSNSPLPSPSLSLRGVNSNQGVCFFHIHESIVRLHHELGRKSGSAGFTFTRPRHTRPNTGFPTHRCFAGVTHGTCPCIMACIMDVE